MKKINRRKEKQSKKKNCLTLITTNMARDK